MTPREFCLQVEAYNERIEEKQEQRRQELYVSALLISQFVGIKLFSKRKIPAYDEIFEAKHEMKEMTDEQMLRKVEALNAMFGGADTRKAVG